MRTSSTIRSIISLLSLLLSWSCAPAPRDANWSDVNGISVAVDSVHHVACYQRYEGSSSLSCVALDSTNSRAIGR